MVAIKSINISLRKSYSRFSGIGPEKRASIQAIAAAPRHVSDDLHFRIRLQFGQLQPAKRHSPLLYTQERYCGGLCRESVLRKNPPRQRGDCRRSLFRNAQTKKQIYEPSGFSSCVAFPGVLSRLWK
jgi:hypothetical protein